MNARQRNRLIDCLVSGILAYVAGIIVAHIIKPTEAGVWITAMTALVWITALNVWRGIEHKKIRDRAFKKLDEAAERLAPTFYQTLEPHRVIESDVSPTSLLAASAALTKRNAALIESMLEQAHIAPEDLDQYRIKITRDRACLTRQPGGELVSFVHLMTAEDMAGVEK